MSLDSYSTILYDVSTALAQRKRGKLTQDWHVLQLFSYTAGGEGVYCLLILSYSPIILSKESVEILINHTSCASSGWDTEIASYIHTCTHPGNYLTFGTFA